MSMLAPHRDIPPSSEAWHGRTGLQRMLAVAPVQVDDPDRFRAERRSVVVDGVTLDEWRCTPLTVHVAPRTPGTPPGVRLSVVTAGSVRYLVGDEQQEGGRGSVHLATDDEPVDLVHPEPTQVVSVVVPLSQLPDAVRRAELPPAGRLCRTTSTTGFMVLLEQVVAASRTAEASVHTVRAVRALVASVLLEHVAEPDDVDADLRQRIVDHIESHLHDPDLGPRTIACEFEVSLRWVHRVFNTGDVSLARWIRERRVDAVAARMRTDPRPHRVAALASDHGFAGRDQLTRAFRARYGMTANEYQDIAQRGLDLPEPRPGTE